MVRLTGRLGLTPAALFHKSLDAKTSLVYKQANENDWDRPSADQGALLEECAVPPVLG